MDYTSFAPGASAKPNIPPKLEPALPPHQRHIPKFIAVIIMLLLLCGTAYGGVWWWQQMQNLNQAQDIPTFTPRATNQTKDWHVYTNEEYGFQLTFPDYLKGYSIISLSPNHANIYDYAKFAIMFPVDEPGASELKKRGQSPLGILFTVYIIPVAQWKDGTQDGLASPVHVYVGKNNKYVFGFDPAPNDPTYHITLPVGYNPSPNGLNITSPYSSIKSFFTILQDTSAWKTYTNTQYGFEFKYLPTMHLENKIVVGGINLWTNKRWDFVQKNSGIDAFPDFSIIWFSGNSELDQAFVSKNIGGSVLLTSEQKNIGARIWSVLKCTELCDIERYIIKTTTGIIAVSPNDQILSTFKFTK